MKRCYHCGQEIPEEQLRYGVRLSLLKTRIFDIVERAGCDGISGNDLFEMTLENRGAKRNVLKTHIHQINDRLESSDFRIEVARNEINGHDAVYRLKKRPHLVGERVIHPTVRSVANLKTET